MASVVGIELNRSEQVMRVWENAVRGSHDFLTEQGIVTLRNQVRDQWLPAVTLWGVLSSNDQLAGFMGCSDTAIEMLFVAPEWQGHGIGRTLIDHALASGHQTVDVNEQNPSALAFYQQMGFIVERRSSHDSQGQPFPILHMRWSGNN